MSYVTFGVGDAYAYPDGEDGLYHCLGCRLLHDDIERPPDFTCVRLDELSAHLREHQAAGHKIPEEAFMIIAREQADHLWWANACPECQSWAPCEHRREP